MERPNTQPAESRREQTEPQSELEKQKVALRFFQNHEPDIRRDPLLQAVVPVFPTLELLDKNTLNLNYQKEKYALDYEYLRHFCVQNNVDYDSLSTKVLEQLTNLYIGAYGEEDGTYRWNQDLLDQSTEGNVERQAGITGAGGVWEFKMTPDRETQTQGAEEIQKAVAQVLIEIARNQSETATKEIPKMAEAPDASGREKYQNDGVDFINKAESHKLPWQEENPILTGIDRSKTTGHLIYNPLFRVVGGRAEYRDFESIESMPVRFYREVNGGEYIDIAARELLCASPEEVRRAMNGEQTLFMEGKSWQGLPKNELPDLDEVTPILGISIGQTTNPESTLLRYARSGQAVMHLHYNLDKDAMEVSFGHVSFDGDPGKDWAFAIAETLGATENKKRGLSIERNPPTQFADLPDKAGLAKIRKMIEFGTENADYLDDEALRSLVFALDLSDISISNEMEVGDYQQIKDLAEEMNKRWYEPAKTRLLGMIAADRQMGSKDITPEVERMIVNRIALSKVTPTKILDMFARQFYGPVAVCMLPRQQEVRLLTGSVTEMPDKLRQLIRSYSRDGRSAVFDEKAVPQTGLEKVASFLNKGKLGPIEIEASFKKFFDDNVLEYSLSWIHDMTSLGVILRSVSKFRTTAEVATYVLKRKLLKMLEIEVQTSHIGSAVKYDKNGESVKAVLDEFISAQTTAIEHKFTEAFSTLTINRAGQETVRYNSRIRATPDRIDDLRMSNRTIMIPQIERVCLEKGSGSTQTVNEKRRLAYMALEACEKERAYFYPQVTSKDDLNISNMLIVTKVLESVGEEPWERSVGVDKNAQERARQRREEILEGLKLLTIAGLVEQQKRFVEVSIDASTEAKLAVEA